MVLPETALVGVEMVGSVPSVFGGNEKLVRFVWYTGAPPCVSKEVWLVSAAWLILFSTIRLTSSPKAGFIGVVLAAAEKLFVEFTELFLWLELPCC